MLFSTIPIGDKRYTNSISSCTECGMKAGTSPEHYKAVVNCEQQGIPQDLPSRTFPDLEKVYASRLQIENQINAGEDLPRQLRTFLIEEPFLFLLPKIQNGITDKITVPAFLLCLATISIYMDAKYSERMNSAPSTFAIFATCAALCAGHAFWVTQANRRFMHKHIYPLIAKCLKPLKPDTDEIKAVLSALPKRDHSATKHIQLEQLMDFLER